MLPLAIILKQAGNSVSGEDDALTPTAWKYLDKHNIKVATLESLEDSEAVETVVRSSAINDRHPSIVEAKNLGCRILARGEQLAELVEDKRLIAVAGSHGKTSTCGILIDLLEEFEVYPSYAIGGLFSNGKDPGCWNDSDWAVVEVDESDGTIESFNPDVSIILNINHDHHAYYRHFDDYLASFSRLFDRTKNKVVLPASIREVFREKVDRDKIIWADEEELPTIQSNQIGAYSRRNQRAALAGLGAAGIRIPEKLEMGFTAIARRQSILYRSPEVIVFEDYAHHPAEIRAFREALEEAFSGPLSVVFQPHRYSRTLNLKSELAEELAKFNSTSLLDVYSAAEPKIDGGTGRDLFECLGRKSENCRYVESKKDLIKILNPKLGNEKIQNIVFLGAGETDILAEKFVEDLKQNEPVWGGLFESLAPIASSDLLLRRNEPLLKKTTLRVGGVAEMYMEPTSEQELVAALTYCFENRIPVFPLGRGSNLIVPDEGVRGLVIRLTGPNWKRFERTSEDSIRVGAGLRIKELCGLACRHGLEGFEFLEGIPGSVGGSLRMNAGAMGGWIFDLVRRVRFAKLDGSIIEAGVEELTVGYRHCRELENAIAIDVVMKPKSSGQNVLDLRRAIDVYQSKRKESQPREPSAGCIFKNPEGDSAGRIIEELGLKGTAIGGAEISRVHGNFIVNRGGASSDDVIELVKLVRREALAKRRVELQPEALLYGNSWEEALR
ncbi:MAG TPA: UDP-N-acetylenolpyruvoylglucosamine reductase [Opitutae bacterium]|nr:UDP-N-acetylenolpyruvoylglucosamine reductase [Opitutaceae bacterium]HCR28700.1 UDP-N-acetylenolpyruvoylglucosamine reductase [Opitutae bacterium]